MGRRRNKKKINPGPKRKRPLKIEGQVFQSLADASKVFKLHRDTIRARCLSKTSKFKDWQFLDTQIE